LKIARFLAKILAGDKERILYFAWQRGKEEDEEEEDTDLFRQLCFLFGNNDVVLVTFNFWAFWA